MLAYLFSRCYKGSITIKPTFKNINNLVCFSHRRNDAIKHVREAAELALSRIGGEEAEKAMKVTKILSDEMTILRGQATKV